MCPEECTLCWQNNPLARAIYKRGWSQWQTCLPWQKSIYFIFGPMIMESRHPFKEHKWTDGMPIDWRDQQIINKKEWNTYRTTYYDPKFKSSIIDPRATNLRSNIHGNSATATRSTWNPASDFSKGSIGSTWFCYIIDPTYFLKSKGNLSYSKKIQKFIFNTLSEACLIIPLLSFPISTGPGVSIR